MTPARYERALVIELPAQTTHSKDSRMRKKCGLE
jgi:hypothetical protein